MGCISSKTINQPLDPVVPIPDPVPIPVPAPIPDLIVEIEDYLSKEVEMSKNTNISYVFQDIVDDKHMKYMDRYESKEETVFWGLGIENESYFMLQDLCKSTDFPKLRQKCERYSVDYYKNFKPEPLQATLEQCKKQAGLTYPVYVNSHTFQKTDIKGQHRTFYDVHSTPNPAFTESIHDILLRECPYYKEKYDKAFVFDGDSNEFITQNFYNATVSSCVSELVDVKQRFLSEVAPFFKKWKIGTLLYPDHNYGLATFLTTRKANLLLCNNGTLHVNLTLPTVLRGGLIADKNVFAKTHLILVEYIQMVEPLIVACYGTPDVFSVVDPAYSIGSLRVSLSRYISLQTFNASSPINGKLLLMDRPSDLGHWYNHLDDSPYITNQSIGFDINFNKFKNHGVEIRFLEWFPEEYLTDLMNFFILLAQHSLTIGQVSFKKEQYRTIILSCIQRGFTYKMSDKECDIILSDLSLPRQTFSYTGFTPFDLLQYISTHLYRRYADSELVQKMSPGMKRPVLVNYNRIAYEKLYRDVHGPSELIIRAEHNPLEARTPLVPDHIAELLPYFTIKVESSEHRCFSDEAYRAAGATIVEKGYWVDSRHSYVIGLKAIQTPASASQTLLHFAHCFKGQEGSKETLALLKDCTFIDYEYMLTKMKQRIISFCAQSGKIGAYLALMAFHQDEVPPFDEEVYKNILLRMTIKPRVLLIGHGTAGKAARNVMEQCGISCTIWTSHHTGSRQDILDHDVLIHAIRLPDNPSKISPPFLLKEDLSLHRTLSVVCDISCDMGNPRNTLPIYSEYTSASQPVQNIGNLKLIAINNLPSMEPTVSSTEFSTILKEYLPELPFMKISPDPKADVLLRSYQTFLSFTQMNTKS